MEKCPLIYLLAGILPLLRAINSGVDPGSGAGEHSGVDGTRDKFAGFPSRKLRSNGMSMSYAVCSDLLNPCVQEVTSSVHRKYSMSSLLSIDLKHALSSIPRQSDDRTIRLWV